MRRFFILLLAILSLTVWPLSSAYASPQSGEPTPAKTAMSYGLTYSDGILSVSFYDVASLSPEIRCFISSMPLGPDFYVFKLFSDYSPWEPPAGGGLYQCDVTTTFRYFTPGHYTFKFDNLCYEVDVEEGLDIRLTPEQASSEWNYSSDVEPSECKNGYYAPRENSDFTEENPWEYGKEPFYEVKYAEGTLEIMWRNIIETCGVSFHGATFRQEDNVLTFYLEPEFDLLLADCICIYDVNTTFTDIAPGDYRIVLDEKEYELNIRENMEVVLTRDNSTTGLPAAVEHPSLLSVSGKVAAITADGSYRLEVFSAEGLKMLDYEGRGATEVDLGTLPAGFYVVRLYADGTPHSLLIKL